MTIKSEPPGAGKRSIGQLAKAAGVNIETIRYYHRRGLLPQPPRRLGGQRHYPESALRQIAFIRRAQHLGFTLEEVAALLRLSEGKEDCALGRDFAQRKYDELSERIAVLTRMRRQLAALKRKCEANDGSAECPLVKALRGED